MIDQFVLGPGTFAFEIPYYGRWREPKPGTCAVIVEIKRLNLPPGMLWAMRGARVAWERIY